MTSHVLERVELRPVCEWLAEFVVDALLDEARLAPKPGMSTAVATAHTPTSTSR